MRENQSMLFHALSRNTTNGWAKSKVFFFPLMFLGGMEYSESRTDDSIEMRRVGGMRERASKVLKYFLCSNEERANQLIFCSLSGHVWLQTKQLSSDFSVLYITDSQAVGRGPLVGRDNNASRPPNNWQNPKILLNHYSLMVFFPIKPWECCRICMSITNE